MQRLQQYFCGFVATRAEGVQSVLLQFRTDVEASPEGGFAAPGGGAGTGYGLAASACAAELASCGATGRSAA